MDNILITWKAFVYTLCSYVGPEDINDEKKLTNLCLIFLKLFIQKQYPLEKLKLPKDGEKLKLTKKQQYRILLLSDCNIRFETYDQLSSTITRHDYIQYIPSMIKLFKDDICKKMEIKIIDLKNEDLCLCSLYTYNNKPFLTMNIASEMQDNNDDKQITLFNFYATLFKERKKLLDRVHSNILNKIEICEFKINYNTLQDIDLISKYLYNPLEFSSDFNKKTFSISLVECLRRIRYDSEIIKLGFE